MVLTDVLLRNNLNHLNNIKKAPNGAFLGKGSKMIGLSHKHRFDKELLNEKNDLGFIEVITENWIDDEDLTPLKELREKYQITLHGVSLNIGSFEPVNKVYLKKLKRLIDEINPIGISDHLCFTGTVEGNSHALLPISFTKKNLDRIAEKLNYVQEFLGRKISLENLSAYVKFNDSEMSEAEFLTELVKKCGSGIMLDVNNLVVDERNFGTDPIKYIEQLPADAIKEIHIAGYQDQEQFFLDMHNNPMSDRGWEVYEAAIKKVGKAVPTLLERDEDIPPMEELLEELRLATEIQKRVL